MSTPHPDPYDDAIAKVIGSLTAEKPLTEWTPDQAGQILAGTLVRTESETRTNRTDDTEFTVDYLVIDSYDDGRRQSVQIKGRRLKNWYGANSFAVKPGVILAVRYDGLTDSKWPEYTAKPDSRDGEEFIMAPGQPGEDPADVAGYDDPPPF